MTKTRHALVLLLGTSLAVAGCRPSEQRTDSVDPSEVRARLPARVASQLDSGTVAFRAHDFEQALAHYRRATEDAPDEAAGWFGVYMALRALGREADADSALARVREVAPGATLLHPEEGAS